VSGRVVSRLHDGFLERGRQTFTWDSRGVASGIYFVVGRTGDQQITRRAMVIH
jgi:hypothetical protein